MKHSFSSLSDHDCEILILGSLPGDVSLQKKQYYAHPRNAFWRIMCDILGEEFSDNYTARCDMLLRHKIALWDVVHSANRKGSLDTAIKNHTPNDFNAFFHQHPHVRKILLNGGKAATLFHRHCTDSAIPTIALPSTSPAYAGMKYEEKYAIWYNAIHG